MKRHIRRLVGALFALLFAVIVVRGALTVDDQLALAPVVPVAIDAEAAARRLGGALQIETISYDDATRRDAQAFERLHRYLETTFPIAHATLDREFVNDSSVLYTWEGLSNAEKPILLLAHLDVVPVDAGDGEQWTHPPFGGRILNGFVWGRGSLDMKVAATAQLEAVQWLAGQGFRPRRTIFFAFGHDEELGGEEGAKAIADLLKRRNVQLAFTLDEGLMVLSNVFRGVDRPVALVGVAEKGFLTVKLTASGVGGHSSNPPKTTAIGSLARALSRLESRPMPAAIRAPVSDMFDFLDTELPPHLRTVIANRWLFEPFLIAFLERSASTNVLVRTTSAITMLAPAGVKENSIPTEASAVVNFRIAPGESVESVLEAIHETIEDETVKIEKVGFSREPSAITDHRSDEFALLHKTIRQVLPDVVVAPSLLPAGTDSKHYAVLSDFSFRFLPIRLEKQDLRRFHGIDERIAIENYVEIVRFYVQLLQNAAG